MNNVTLIARLARDPESRQTKGGTTVVDLRVAVSRPKKDGEDQPAMFFTVVAYGKLGDVCAEHLESGREVGITGRLEHREWENEANEKRSVVEIVASSIDFLRSSGQETKVTAAAEEEVPF